MLLAQSTHFTFCQYRRKAGERQPSQPLHWEVQMLCSCTIQTASASQELLETMDSVGHLPLIWVSSKAAAI